MVLGGCPFPGEVHVMGRKGPLPPFPPSPSVSTSPRARSEAVWLAQTSPGFPYDSGFCPAHPHIHHLQSRTWLGPPKKAPPAGVGRQGPEAQGGSEGWEFWGPGVVTGPKWGPGPGLLGSPPLVPHTSCPLSRGLASFPATMGAPLRTVFVSSPSPMPTAPIPEEAQEEGKWVQDPSPYPRTLVPCAPTL